MTLVKVYYVLRLSFFAAVAGISLFWMGWYMGQHNFKQEVRDALKADATHQASLALANWARIDPKYKNDPVFYASCAVIHLKNGNIDAAKYNLNKSLDLMGK